MPVLDAIWAFLFKYRPTLFAEGQLALRPPVPEAWILLGGLASAGLVGLVYWRAAGKARVRDRAVLAALRLGALLVLVLALLRPTLLLSGVVPQQNYIGILIDDSRSMRIADAAGRPRGQRANEALVDPASPVVRALQQRFRLRYYHFSQRAERLDPAAPLTFSGGVTRLASALDAVRAELSGLPHAGLVLVSDGADNATSGVTESLLALKAAGLPVFTVGVGQERFGRDLEVGRVALPRSALRGSALLVDVPLTQTGFAGRTVPLRVEDEGRIVATHDVQLPGDGSPTTVRISFTLAEPGVRRLTFRVPVQEGELIQENNQQQTVVQVRDDREKILYFEGEPRWELKFLRRAAAQDSNLQVVTLQRTARNKYLRLDVDSAGELSDGFPRTREELFRYRALILGSVEASYFTHEQLQMIADFVAERGGGLLVLGGRLALAEGGYAGTPVAEALPFALDPGHAHDSTYFAELRVRPTRAGLEHPALHLWPDSVDAGKRWETLPALTSVNHVGSLKSGATALLDGRGPATSQPVLAYQRFGRGLVIALPVQDTWLWQMHADMAADDQTHETLWRQLLRWLVSDVPDRILATAPDRVLPGEAVRIGAVVGDARFLPVNDSRVQAQVITPGGQSLDVPLAWALERDGEYRGSFVPADPGLYEIRVRSTGDTAATESAPTAIEVGDGDAEFFRAQRGAELLQLIARETGGRAYDISALRGLPEDLAYAGHGATVPEERDLWDMPALLLALVLLLGGEWTYRRMRGLA